MNVGFYYLFSTENTDETLKKISVLSVKQSECISGYLFSSEKKHLCLSVNHLCVSVDILSVSVD